MSGKSFVESVVRNLDMISSESSSSSRLTANSESESNTACSNPSNSTDNLNGQAHPLIGSLSLCRSTHHECKSPIDKQDLSVIDEEATENGFCDFSNNINQTDSCSTSTSEDIDAMSFASSGLPQLAHTSSQGDADIQFLARNDGTLGIDTTSVSPMSVSSTQGRTKRATDFPTVNVGKKDTKTSTDVSVNNGRLSNNDSGFRIDSIHPTILERSLTAPDARLVSSLRTQLASADTATGQSKSHTSINKEGTGSETTTTRLSSADEILSFLRQRGQLNERKSFPTISTKQELCKSEHDNFNRFNKSTSHVPNRKSERLSSEALEVFRQNTVRIMMLNRLRKDDISASTRLGRQSHVDASNKNTSGPFVTDKSNQIDNSSFGQQDDSEVSSIGDQHDNGYFDDEDPDCKDSTEYRVSCETIQTTHIVKVLLTSVAIITILITSLAAPLMHKQHIQCKMLQAWDEVVDQLFNHVAFIGAHNIQALATLSCTLTSYSLLVRSKNSSVELEGTWPFVTDPHFPINSLYTRSQLQGVSNIWTTPIVLEKDRSQWEIYSRERSDLIKNSSTAVSTTLHGSLNTGIVDISSSIYNLDAGTSDRTQEEINSGTTTHFYPIWQISNVTGDTILDVNFNIRSIQSIGVSLDYSIENNQAVVSPMVPGSEEEANITQLVSVLSLHQSTVNLAIMEETVKPNNDAVKKDPISVMTVPIMNSFNRLQESSAADHIDVTMASLSEKGNNVVGSVSASFVWSSYFENVFTNHAMGSTSRDTNIYVVLDSTACVKSGMDDKSFDSIHTFQIHGSNATYLGVGDSHHREWTSFRKSLKFEERVNYQLTQLSDTMGLSLVTLSDSYCPYMIHVYPTAEFQHQFNSYWPVVAFVLTVVLIWSFVLIVFFCFGNYIEKQIKILLVEGSYNRIVINKLFPKDVQERMRQVQQKPGATSNGKSMFTSADKNDSLTTNPSCHQRDKMQQKQEPLSAVSECASGTSATVTESVSVKGEGGGCPVVPMSISDTPPIADSFPETTVMFADIAGFTAWSSGRNPVEVFTLLESMYNSFDILAQRKGIFKVETIGDCYMCVTGLPVPRQDHAPAMASFSYHCLRQVRRVVKQLAPRLGSDVLTLTIRVGMHSGAVTAGVLRGEKSRFQLFGDTVNTASRMESTGERGKIQLSESSANELKLHGYESWFRPRPGGVEAKGKGQIQTYWLVTDALKSQEHQQQRASLSLNNAGDNQRVVSRKKTFGFQRKSSLLSDDELSQEGIKND